MEEIVIYLLKSSGLLATFFLAYHFLLRKETFFTSNRWFLLSGLATSILLPLFFIKKIVYVERPKFTLPIISEDNDLPIIIDKATPIIAESIDWFQILFIVYAIVATILIIKVIIDLVSLGKLLRKQNIQKQEDLLYVNINQDIAPFSFFNYIVFNSNLYSQKELESILLHEKVHSQEKHSIDVLVTKLFTVIFWFNPLVWLYQKAIIQNLEYIADSKAIQNIEDKKCYQMALLKVVSHQNCLPITNHFYQSLIKKRIVMLNKNQSKKRNLWKYGLILPVIIAFVFLFQIKVVAQEKEVKINKIKSVEFTPSNNKINTDVKDLTYIIDKITTDNEIKELIIDLKNQFEITLSYSNLVRNNKDEITSIQLDYKDSKGNKGTTEQKRTIPIRSIFFKITDSKNPNFVPTFFNNSEMVTNEIDEQLEKKISFIEFLNNDDEIYVDGTKYDKESLELLDPEGLETLKIVTDKNILKNYVTNNERIIVITTNWVTRKNWDYKNGPDITEFSISFDSNDPDEGLLSDSMFTEFKKIGIDVKIENIKRNKDNKIISISVLMNSKEGKRKKLEYNNPTSPIKSINVFAYKNQAEEWEFGVIELKEEIIYKN